MKRAQIVALDLISAAVLFVLFAVVFILLIFALPRFDADQTEFEFEMLFALDNLEHNLRLDPATQFYQDYRIDPALLVAFSTQVTDIDPYIIGNLSTQGLGLIGDAYDVCLYFTDNDQSLVTFGGVQAIGQLQSSSCHQKISAGQNPCDEYSHAATTFQPVLYDQGGPNVNRILQMNVVACKI